MLRLAFIKIFYTSFVDKIHFGGIINNVEMKERRCKLWKNLILQV